MGFRAAAQDKLLVAGSGNPNILLLDKQTGKVEWQHALEKGEECNAVALTKKGEILYSYKRGAKLVTWDHQVVWDYKHRIRRNYNQPPCCRTVAYYWEYVVFLPNS